MNTSALFARAVLALIPFIRAGVVAADPVPGTANILDEESKLKVRGYTGPRCRTHTWVTAK